MNLRFNAIDILKIAERVEQKEYEFYNNAQKIFETKELKALCQDLGFWNQQQKKQWLQQRQDLAFLAPYQTTEANHGTGLQDASAMAGLTWFGQRPNSPAKLRGLNKPANLLQAAAKRGRDLIVFYQGLKAFSLDQTSLHALEDIITRQWQYLEYIDRLAQGQTTKTDQHCIAVA